MDKVTGNRVSPASTSGKVVRFLLLRYLLFSWTANLLPILGVAVGMFFFSVVLSIMGGYVKNLKGRLLRLESHIEIVVKDGFGTIPENKKLLESLPHLSSDILGVSPFQKGDAIVQSATRPMTVTLVGVDPSYARRGTDYENYLGGRDLGILEKPMLVNNGGHKVSLPPVILGAELFNILATDLGERVTIVSTTREQGPFGLAPTQFPAAVVDELVTGSASVDAKWVIANLDFVNSFFGTEGQWAGIVVKLRDPLLADDVSKTLNSTLSRQGLRAKPWTESNHALLKALQLERWGMSFVLGMVILVGCFGITIVLVLSVKRKSREMAILRSLGLRRTQLGLVYLLQGLAIGSAGVLVGLNLGLWALHMLQVTDFSFLMFAGRRYPVLVDWGQLLVAVGGSVVLSVVASLWPAWEVMRIDPVEVLSDKA